MLLFLFQINRLQLLLTNVSTNPSEILIAKSMLSGQLQSLTQRFKNLTSDDNCEYEEANINFADTTVTTKHISLLKDIEELVCNEKVTIPYLLYIFYLKWTFFSILFFF